MNDTKIVRTLAPVDFHGQSLTVIDREGKPYVAMRPVVEGIGLDWRSQHVKLSVDILRQLKQADS